MSIQAMTAVWANSRHDGPRLLLLLAIADYANDEGVAFPSITALRRKARLGKTQCYDALAVLKGSGELEILERGGGRTTTRYRVVPAKAEHLQLFTGKRAERVPPRGPKSGPVRNSGRVGNPDRRGADNRTAPVRKSGPVTVTDPSREPGTPPTPRGGRASR